MDDRRVSDLTLDELEAFIRGVVYDVLNEVTTQPPLDDGPTILEELDMHMSGDGLDDNEPVTAKEVKKLISFFSRKGAFDD